MMKKLLSILCVASLFAGASYAQETEKNVTGTYAGKVYTAVKDSVEKQSNPIDGEATLMDNGSGAYSLTLTNVSTGYLDFNDITLENVKLDPSSETGVVLQRESAAMELTTKDGKTVQGTMEIDSNESAIHDNNMSVTLIFHVGDTGDLRIVFAGAKPDAAPTDTPPTPAP
jgi:TPP-dependent 2-oxoacid decarboxylase